MLEESGMILRLSHKIYLWYLYEISHKTSTRRGNWRCEPHFNRALLIPSYLNLTLTENYLHSEKQCFLRKQEQEASWNPPRDFPLDPNRLTATSCTEWGQQMPPRVSEESWTHFPRDAFRENKTHTGREQVLNISLLSISRKNQGVCISTRNTYLPPLSVNNATSSSVWEKGLVFLRLGIIHPPQ